MSSAGKPKGPVFFDLDAPEPTRPGKTVSEEAALTPATAPLISDSDALAPTGQTMQTLVQLGARRPSRLARFFWAALVALLGFLASVAAWEFVTGLLNRSPVLGYVAMGLTGLFLLALLLVALREWLALIRLGRMDGLRVRAEQALANGDLRAARGVRAVSYTHLTLPTKA